MALEACVMKVRPLKLVFCRNQGSAPQWSRWKLREDGWGSASWTSTPEARFERTQTRSTSQHLFWTHWLMSSRSISAGSIRSMYGRASIPSRPGWMPQSSWNIPTHTHTDVFTRRVYCVQLMWRHKAALPWSSSPWTPGWCRTVPPPDPLLCTKTHHHMFDQHPEAFLSH